MIQRGCEREQQALDKLQEVIVPFLIEIVNLSVKNYLQ